ncbi:MAG: cytochrome c-type biogenesis protein CcmH [Caulobacterales bacterium]|nr:cytochrome c-type biogenesis protein CcmH [Caulobacterales bacterium]
MTKKGGPQNLRHGEERAPRRASRTTQPAFLILLAVLTMAGAASDPSERLPDPAQEARARALFSQVRCLVCQNESIDDSDAELAADLRKVVREQIAAGRSDAQVKTFLTDRYGEFVLLAPRFSLANAPLWFAGLAVVLAGLGLLVSRWRRREVTQDLNSEEESRLAALLDDEPA